MRDRELRRLSADFLEAPRGASMQPQLRRSSVLSDHLDITPQHALRVSGSQRFHRGFFRREPSGKMNRGISAAHAVCDFALGEDSMGELLVVSFDRRRDSGNVSRVES